MAAKEPCVLVIERASDLRQLNELILQEAGYAVEAVSSDQDPVKFAARTRPAVIVLRIQPNKSSDWQILDALQADPQTEKIPVVVLSAYKCALPEALSAPIVRQTVIMPYDIDALQRAVADALHHPPPAAVLPQPHHPPPKSLAAAGALLNAHSREIALRAIQRLQQIEPFKSHFAELSPGLVDDLPVILGAVIIGLQRDLTPDEIVVPAIREAIRAHVNLRVRQGLEPSSVLREYQVLNDQILGFLRAHIGAAHLDAVEAFDVARTLDDDFAEILRIAVNDFLQKKQKQIRAAAA